MERNSKESLVKTKKTNIVVEVPLPDGCVSMYVGELAVMTEERITLRKVSWISDTGRRHLFFAGTPDSNVEIEPYPDEITISFSARSAIVTLWPHPLPRQVR